MLQIKKVYLRGQTRDGVYLVNSYLKIDMRKKSANHNQDDQHIWNF